MGTKPKYYWDACAWIGLIQREPTRIDSLQYTVDLARDGGAEIWTSTFTLAEVFKRPCANGDQIGLLGSQDDAFEDYIIQDFVKKVEVTSEIGILARRLLRRYPKLKKPQDAIHVASALFYNLDELHTFDRPDLLRFNRLIPRRDGELLCITHPPVRPPPPEPVVELPDPQYNLLDQPGLAPVSSILEDQESAPAEGEQNGGQ